MSAEPWYTGPLLAQPADSLPLGHSQLEIYGYNFHSSGFYDQNYVVTDSLSYRSEEIMLKFIYGLADRIDIEWDAPYFYNETLNNHNSNIGDLIGILGYQLLEQNQYQPDLKITFSEIFPTGRYDRLKVSAHGMDSTGTGSFQSILSLNMKYQLQMSEMVYLNTYANMAYLIASSVYLSGISSYGGNIATKGTLQPGNLTSFDLAFELILTQHWATVLEGYMVYQTASSFRPARNIANVETVITHIRDRKRYLAPNKYNLSGAGIGNDDTNVFTLLPSIEYNFSAHYGMIAGIWFTVSGKRTPEFLAPMIAFNATF